MVSMYHATTHLFPLDIAVPGRQFCRCSRTDAHLTVASILLLQVIDLLLLQFRLAIWLTPPLRLLGTTSQRLAPPLGSGGTTRNWLRFRDISSWIGRERRVAFRRFARL